MVFCSILLNYVIAWQADMLELLPRVSTHSGHTLKCAQLTPTAMVCSAAAGSSSALSQHLSVSPVRSVVFVHRCFIRKSWVSGLAYEDLGLG